VTDGKLRMIERAESAVRAIGFRVCRVRHHDVEHRPGVPAHRARVEIGSDELARALEPSTHARIVQDLLALGYEEVTVDPKGYRMGSLNEGLRLRPV
jgi:uncharacterized protein